MIKKDVYKDYGRLTEILDNLTEVSLELLDIAKSTGDGSLEKKEKNVKEGFNNRVNDKRVNLSDVNGGMVDNYNGLLDF